ncbi:MAG: cytochrome c oxidase subunit II [Calditrichaeota bacterium]|nr:MAG: cytochrome c oxidase subunit II [Calditrichota bacterium]
MWVSILHHNRYVILILALFVIVSNSMAEGNPERGKQLFATCVACHGEKGAGNIQFKAPSIAGQESWYLRTQLMNFRKGVRGTSPLDTSGLTMRPMALTLPDEQAVEDVIAYIKTFPIVAHQPTLKGDAQHGKALFAVCQTCHGPNAQGNESLHAPKLSGLPDWYIVQQLKKFKAGIRGTHPQDQWGQTMRPMALTLQTEQDMKDVAAYILSLSGQAETISTE